MNLAEYISSNRGAASALARELGVTPSTVSRWAARRMEPSLAMCARIERATNGAVTVRDMIAAVEAA